MGSDDYIRKRKALIIGISSYDKLEPLSFCEYDGKEIFNVLSSLQYEVAHNKPLIGYIQWNNLRDSIYDFFNNEITNPEDTLLFYYSGHGIPDGDQDVYLATSETDPYQPSRRGFNFNELTKLMRESISTRTVSILDCCYSGSAENRQRP